MFEIEITPEANAKLRTAIGMCGLIRPGLVIHRRGPVGELTRTNDGNALWTIERPDASWSVQIASLEIYPENDLLLVNGFRIHLAIIPKAGEKGIRINVHYGEFIVEGINV